MRQVTRSLGFLITLCGGLWATTAVAQESARRPPQRLSIRQALERAPKASESLRRARAALRSRQGEQRAARSGYFPQAAVNAAYERTLRSEFDAVFEAPTNGAGEGLAFEELPFGRANIYRFGITLNQNLYAGGRTRAETRIAKAGAASATIGVTSARAQALLDTARAYYDAVLTDRFVAIAQSALSQAEETLADVRVGYEAGTRPEFELLRARVAVDLQRPVLIRQRTAQRMAYLRLQQLLDLPVGEPLELVSTLDDNALAPLAAHARRVIGARPEHAERAPVRQALEDAFARDAAIAAARASQLPSVDLYMTYGRVAYPEDLSPTWDDFRTNWVVGLSLSWTVFDGFRTSGNVQAAQGARDQALMDLRLAREAAAFEFVEASQELTAARAVWEASGSSAEEARKAYVIARLRYEEGVSTQLELSDARLRVQQALAERAQAARDFQVARVRVALLPALPFSSAPAAPLPVQTSPQARAEERDAAAPAAASGTNAASPAGAGSARSP